MQQSIGHRPTTATAVIGLLLVAVGVVALVLRELVGVNFFASIGPWGWPFFIIVPGVVLLGLALVPAPPRGIGFAIAGAIVTTVGALLLYQSQTEHWESWAYAWALIPMSAGVAMVLYGLLTGTRRLVSSGLWMAGIAAVVFAAGAWFFEGIFAGEQRPLDIGNWWPVGVMVLGALIVIRAFISSGSTTSSTTTRAATIESERAEPH
jgi:hypothetical protein